MRVAPVGLLCADPWIAFDLGCDLAALTHGHPSGWLPAGVLAATICGVLHGQSLHEALAQACSLLKGVDGHEETSAAIDAAVRLAGAGPPSPEALETLGAGWVAEEALAISLCCALAVPDLRSGILAAVNHSGDSDSTGSIAGNLLGAVHGVDAIPAEWVANLEGVSLIETMARDAWAEIATPSREPEGASLFGGDAIPARWWHRYPGG